MDAHLIDSAVFGHSWSTELSRTVFGERQRMNRWVQILIALARAQAEVGIIPRESATAIEALDAAEIDIEAVAVGTRETSHSTLGLIQVLRRELPSPAGEHIYYGATVQDVTDTSLALEMRAIGDQLRGDLSEIERQLLQLAVEHRATPMLGRTHGQPGAPITFGFKVASWADEIGRQRERVEQMLDRCVVGQLGGAVGALGFFGPQALALRQAFCAELDLTEPTISWLTARDRLAEFANVAAMTTAMLARIANEVFGLQRQELGEVAEATSASTVGSITMPHKRNPESSEQIVTLSRLVRAQAGVLTETMVQEHERDARGWKAEWVAFPELCHYTMAATSLSLSLIAGLEVRDDVMLSNLTEASATTSEQLLSHLARELGKHQAQALLQAAFVEVRTNGGTLLDLLRDHISPSEFDTVTQIDVGVAPEMVDLVVDRASQRQIGAKN